MLSTFYRGYKINVLSEYKTSVGTTNSVPLMEVNYFVSFFQNVFYQWFPANPPNMFHI